MSIPTASHLAHAAVALVKHAATGATVTGDQSSARLATCRGCQEGYDHTDRYPKCKFCECYLDPANKPFDWMPAKVSLPDEKCHLNKW